LLRFSNIWTCVHRTDLFLPTFRSYSTILVNV
jgi:hypothetical protein